MADFESQELIDALQELNRTMNGLGGVATSGKGQLAEAFNSTKLLAGKGAKAAAAIGDLGTAVTKLTGAIYKGEQGQKKYADAVDDAVTAIASVTMSFGMVAKIATVLGVALIKYGKAATEMGDKLFKSYQDLSRSGAVAADGLRGVYERMQDFRLSLDELPELARIINETRTGLAMWSGTVYDGAKDMGALRKAVTDSNLELEAFGLGINKLELNEHLSSFINLNARLGTIQGKTVDETVKSLRAYIYETDLLTKTQGATRREQEEAQRKAMAVEQYRARMIELQAKARAGDKQAAEELETLNFMMKRYGTIVPGLAEQMAQMATGLIGPGSAGAALLSNMEVYRAMTDRTLTREERMKRIDDAIKNSMDPNKGGLGYFAMSVGKFGDTFKMSADEVASFVQLIGDDDLWKKYQAANTIQEKQALLQEKGLGNLAKTLKADLNSMQSMQDFVEMGVNPATTALRTLADVVDSLTSMLPGVGRPSQPTVASDVARRNAAAQGKGTMSQLAAGMVAETKAMFGGKPAGTLGAIRELIAGVESKGNYNVLVGGRTADLTNMTLQQVYDLQQNLINSGKNSAAGKYQFNRATLMEYASKLGLDPATTKFSADTQDKLADALIKNQGYDKYVAGQMSKEEFLGRLSQRWAGLPKDASGESFHKDVGNNRAGIGYREALASLQQGGVVAGPKSGFMAQLHGTEAVVPLPDGRTIPVTMPDFGDSMRQQISVMGMQIAKLDEIVGLMRNQNTITTKILQYSQN